MADRYGQLSPIELRHKLDSDSSPPLLLDVREPHEFAYCHIDRSRLIPMQDLPARIDELDPEQDVVVICHHGIRSAIVAGFLVQRQFAQVWNLVGGIEAWAREVDPAMPRY